MNIVEKSMLDLLIRGKECHGILAVKAEFEAEGTRVDELLRLLEIVRKADLKVGLKIGGCEAIRDLLECRQFGVDYIIAPMVETPYALSKFIAAKDKVFTEDERRDIDFLFNVETKSTLGHIEELGKMAAAGGVGMVLGRVDFCGSMGKSRDFITSDEMTGYACSIASVAQKYDIDLVTGGGVNAEGIHALRKIRDVKLNRFETRKVIFDAAMLDEKNPEVGIETAVEFELAWLKNKREYYGRISAEDRLRIEMMEARKRARAA